MIRDISCVASLKFWLAQLVSMFILILIGVIIFIALLSQIIPTFPPSPYGLVSTILVTI